MKRERTMKGNNNLEEYTCTVSDEFTKVIPLPENATLKQLNAWNEALAGIILTPLEAVQLAYLTVFDVALDEDEETPNEEEGEA